MNEREMKTLLTSLGQNHIVHRYDLLPPGEQALFMRQIEQTDLSCLSQFGTRDTAVDRGKFSPIPTMTLDEISDRRPHFLRLGTEAIRSGRLAAVILAGGSGTRLGMEGPKGAFDLGITRHVYLYQRLFENLLRTVRDTGTFFHLFIMTSTLNDAETRKFLEEQNCFGYPADLVHFFTQETAPAVDDSGLLLMDGPFHLVTNPNGNGGWLLSMERSGMLEITRREGIEWLNVVAVDNVLQNLCDPVFFCAVLESGCPCGSKVVRKNSPDERVGVMCLEDGKPSVVEYFEMSDEMRSEKAADGSFAYYFGVTLNYLFRIEEASAVMHHRMPLHYAHKPIPFMDESGSLHHPDTPNGWKFEYFIFDLIHELDGCLPFEVERSREFAPVKNRTGIDSVDTARAMLAAAGYEL